MYLKNELQNMITKFQICFRFPSLKYFLEPVTFVPLPNRYQLCKNATFIVMAKADQDTRSESELKTMG
jgi:hypothetical protein